jgi:hypothetical protein
MMTAIQHFPFLYSYSGGMTPESLEVFWVRADGLAEYVAGNPWPRQPPFDEIGHYRSVLTAEERDQLNQLALEIQGDPPLATASARSLDAGVEFFRAQVDERIIEAEWSPTRAPAGHQALARHVRRLIAKTHNTPLSALQAGMVWLNDSNRIRLTLQNRGSEPFIFYDAQHAGQDVRFQVRVRQVTVDESSHPPNPLILAHLKPVPSINAPGWPPDPDGKTSLQPGTSLCLEFHPGTPLPIAGETLECLVRINFWRATPEGEDLLEQGWVLPAPLHFSPGNPPDPASPARTIEPENP